ncbi:MAG: hypothetical protein A3E98_04160 [Candidatus Doudnabacteria bacterium RIFCSPHIGHO2_12_FULL_48_11]|uniref:BIG2 domain-containing protein n=1 Tax=Candidatus Doudnabacteria bacterium RIFCSPHIGHO2_01_FULL_46_24 TaxID=1817825 RepID=A0A1F5NVA0_9BACT|nr:MAG: hypothetical protein A2720_00700 [Candidatus Doudnabacteria bacterium RIFCSPHIGHO2_01_FULL_46_24]OGE95989.1 MAG: hypothetical protein A3E98_04160 [Candidatus Doudnabacteria bacterium RIFCSPHIGHO2_12_FULL_48_11]
MRRTTSLFARSFVVALGIVFASACGGNGPIAPSLTVSPSSAQVQIGTATTLTASQSGTWSVTPANCGSITPGNGDRVEFRGLALGTCTARVSASGQDATSVITVTAGPPEPERARILALEYLKQGDPDCRGDACPPGPVKDLLPDENGCYTAEVGQGVIKLPVSHPAKPGRWLRLRNNILGFVRTTEYPDESKIVGGIGWNTGIFFPNVGEVRTLRFELEEGGGDLPSNTLDVREYKLCRK